MTGPGNPGAGVSVERAAALFAPRAVLFVGVAGGVKDVALGDVVAADAVYDYETGKDTESGFLPRQKTYQSAYGLVQLARLVAAADAWQRRIRPGDDAPRPRAHVKPLAAGGRVVAHHRSDVGLRLAASAGDALAVDMEGFGFLAGAYANQQLDALVIRGISDLLGDKGEAHDERWQPAASRHAAAFAFELISRIPAAGPVAHVRDEGLGKPIGRWDPHDLEVHPAGTATVSAGSGARAQRALPGYVRRGRDQVLADAIDSAAPSSSAGDTTPADGDDDLTTPAAGEPGQNQRSAGIRQRARRSRRRVLVGTGTFLTALGAALATQFVTRLDQGIGDDAPPAPLTARADPLGCPPLYALPSQLSVADIQRKVDEMTDGNEQAMIERWDRFEAGLHKIGADRLIEELDLVVRSSLSDDVVLKRIRIEVVERTKVTPVPSFVIPGGCGDLPEHHYLVDLDDTQPRLSPSAFSYTVHKRDTVRIRLKFQSKQTDCRWRLHLDWDGPQGAETTTLPGTEGTYRTFPADEDDADAIAPGGGEIPTDFPSR
ncbi:hypothetical protein GCM10009577_77380 [Streptomyces javensis]